SEDGWGAAAAATLAVAFSWAAISKITGWARWRRTVGAYALPSSAESVVAWAVPVAETLVPALSLIGHPRAAGAVALLSIAVFTVGLVRLALRDGPHVACGCFGRATVDVRVALARNLAIGVAAAIAWRLAPSDPVLGLPEGSDALPALLVAGAVAGAAITSWRSAVWLGRGRA
ncbi:MAG: MauE/DoxX family redox-associated membrane protein, partial [Actinomycetota bacterium]